MGTFPFAGLSVWLVAKVFILIAIGIYLVFALVVIRQISLMIETVEVGFSFPIRLVGWLHLLFTIGVFLVALVTL
jgi:hypothetical protein